jgi:HEAT repeat protein
MKSDSHRVVPLLVAVVVDKEEASHVRLPLTCVLGIVGEEHEKAFDILGRLLLDTRDTEALRVAAAKCLGENRAGDATPLLRKCEADPSDAVRSAVKSAIEQLESRNK